MERLRTFFQHPNVRHIGARDFESAEWIRRHLTPRVAGRRPCRPRLQPAPAAGGDVRQPTVALNLRTHRAGSDPTALVNVCPTLHERGYDVVNLVLGTGKTRAADLEVARDFPFKDQMILESESIDELSSYLGGLDLLISNKFHGTVVATMYGVSSVVLVGHDQEPQPLHPPRPAPAAVLQRGPGHDDQGRPRADAGLPCGGARARARRQRRRPHPAAADQRRLPAGPVRSAS